MYAELHNLYASYNVAELIKLADGFLSRAEVAARAGQMAEARACTKDAADVRKVITARRVPSEMQKSW